MYVFKSGDTTVILAVYVDDFLITGEDSDLVHKKKTELTDTFEMTDLGKSSASSASRSNATTTKER